MKYGFKVYQVEIENELFWFAESTDLKGCAGQGKTCDEAIRELEENEAVWLQMAEEDGGAIPSPSVEKPLAYSGKFTVRLSKSLHQRAAETADREGISLNAFVIEAIAERVGGAMYGSVVEKIGSILEKFANVVAISTLSTALNYNEKMSQLALQKGVAYKSTLN